MKSSVNTSNATTNSAAPITAGLSSASSQTQDPSVHLSEGLLKLNWLNGLADLRRAQQSNHELLTAQLEQQFGKAVLTPGEEMIAVESPITNTTNHYHVPPSPSPGTPNPPGKWPTWAKLAVLGLGLTGVGGLLMAPLLNKPPASNGTQKSESPGASERSYQLDFWDPTELPAANNEP
jgi:hypothetical protein